MKNLKLVSLLVALGLLVWPNTAALALEAPTIDLLVPENGEVWEVGTTHQINWENGGFLLVDIAYTTTGSQEGPWLTIANDVDTEYTSFYDWVVPNTVTDTALIRLYGHFPNGNGPERYDYGAGTFRIVNPVPAQMLTVVRPNGGEFWKLGSWQRINWTSAGINRRALIKIELNRGTNKWQTIGLMPNLGVFVWHVTGPKTNTALVRVSLVKDTSINDVSDSFFRISNK